MNDLLRKSVALSFFYFSSILVSAQVSQTGGNDGALHFSHTVEKGETVYSIATMYGCTVEEVYRLNPDSRNRIRLGEQLKIVQPSFSADEDQSSTVYAYHTISAGETLYALSRQYKVMPEDVMALNPGLTTATFQIGKTIRIPQQSATLPLATQTVIEKVVKYDKYEVKRRETMYKLTKTLGISSEELIKHNPKLRDGLKRGMILRIPRIEEVEVEKVIEEPQMSEREVNALLAKNINTAPLPVARVSLLLPFYTKEPAKARIATRFVEYYEGFLLAVDSLRRNGLSIDLHVHDVGSGNQAVSNILTAPSLAQSHLIIGAVETGQIEKVASFAKKHEIPYVVPFTSRNDEVLNNAQIFQVNTPHAYLYSKASEEIARRYKDSHIILIDYNDKGRKSEYVTELKRNWTENAQSFSELKFNSVSFSEDLLPHLKPDKQNVVILSSSSLEALNAVRSTLRMYTSVYQPEVEPFKITMFGYPDWQTYVQECLDDFYALGVSFYANFYLDNMGNDAEAYYKKYTHTYGKSWINTYPKYSVLGFDTGMYFLQSLKKNGAEFDNVITPLRREGIQTGFDFHRVNNWGGYINHCIFTVTYNSDYTVTREVIK